MRTALISPWARVIPLAFTMSACTSKAGPETIINVIGDFSGPYSDLEQNAENGMLLALDDINRQGGVLGRTLVFHYQDTHGLDSRGLAATASLLAAGNAPIIAPVSSSATYGMLLLTAPAHVVLMAPGSNSPAFSAYASEGYFFRTIASQSGEAIALARQAYATGKRSVAIIEGSTIYSTTVADIFQSEFTRLGGKVPAVVSYEQPLTPSFPIQQVLTHAWSFNPDAIMLASTTTDGIVVLQSWAGLGGSATWSGGWFVLDSMIFPAVTESVGPQYVQGIIGATPARAHTDSWNYFQKRYQTTYGGSPGQNAPEGYDCAFLLALAIEQAGSTDSEAVHLAMPKVANPPGATVGAPNWSTAVSFLRQGAKIQYAGAAEAQGFDANGDISAATELWQFDGKGQINSLGEVDSQ